MPGFTGLNFFIVIFQYLSMTQHLLGDAAAILSSGTMKSPECVAQFVRLSLHQIALLRFLLTALLLPSLIHTSQFLICFFIPLVSMCLYTISLHSPIPPFILICISSPPLSLSYTFAGYTFPPHLSIGLSLSHTALICLSLSFSLHIWFWEEKNSRLRSWTEP